MTTKIFVRKFVILIVCVISLDFLVGILMEHFYINIKGGDRESLTIALERQTDEILIFGSSRANRHYIPSIFTDSLDASCYNVGRDGQAILFHLATLEVILERYIPEKIILDVRFDELEFDKGGSTYGKLRDLKPYFKNNPILWNTIARTSDEKLERIKHLSFIYPYNSLFFFIIEGNLSFSRKPSWINGYLPLVGVWNDELTTSILEPLELDEIKVKAFESFCLKCKEHNIDLVVAISPMYMRFEGHNLSLDYILDFCNNKNIPFINFLNKEEYNNNLYFRDIGHLNHDGAQVFSSHIVHLIKEL